MLVLVTKVLHPPQSVLLVAVRSKCVVVQPLQLRTPWTVRVVGQAGAEEVVVARASKWLFALPAAAAPSELKAAK